MTAEFKLFQVGGAVRDRILGLTSKDIDFSVVVTTPVASVFLGMDFWFIQMNEWLREQGFEIFLETPEFLTTRARFPKSANKPRGQDTADFVLARREGPYSDGRHPDWVAPGSLEDDLARRDFTVNALAIEEGTDEIIDLFDGLVDLKDKTLACVGIAKERMQEDALRALRAIRFRVTKGLEWDAELSRALNSEWLPPLLNSVSAERKREELRKCFRVNTLETLDILHRDLPRDFLEAVFVDGLRLEPTLKI